MTEDGGRGVGGGIGSWEGEFQAPGSRPRDSVASTAARLITVGARATPESRATAMHN